jgi:acetyl-CoA carboxylase biotin carboxyl carrier protein
VDIRKIKKLIELLEESALTEIEISEGEESIRLSRSSPLDPAESTTANPLPARLTETPSPSRESSSIAATLEDLPGTVPVVSPMVGTFYAAPNPESSPYVKTGSEVTLGDTLCVIEAMKIFNHVDAECSGVIRKILKNSGDPVEFGETLFLIETLTEESAN